VSSPRGDCAGDSICRVRVSACHDEKVLYHVKAGDQSDHLVITGSKIVGGKEVVMGTIPDCKWNATAASIRCYYSRGTLAFDVNGDKMGGTLTTDDGLVLRKITLLRRN
jgi:hypothetical protein